MAGKSPVTSTQEQIAALELKAVVGSDGAEADRARAILLTLRGWTSPRIAEAFGVREDEDTVRLWRSEFMDSRVEALETRPLPGPTPLKTQAAFRVADPLLSAPAVTAGNAFSSYRFRRSASVRALTGTCTLAPLFGAVRSVEQRLGAYAQHGANHSLFSNQLPQRLRWRLEHDAARHEALRAKSAELGLRAHPEPALRDAFHLENRIGSLCLDPAHHPTSADSRLSLALRGVWAIRRARLRAVLAAWFLCVGMLPRTAAAHVAAWRLGPTSRPVAVNRLASRIRAATY